MKHLSLIMLEDSIRFARNEKGITLKELADVLVEILDESELEALMNNITLCLQESKKLP